MSKDTRQKNKIIHIDFTQTLTSEQECLIKALMECTQKDKERTENEKQLFTYPVHLSHKANKKRGIYTILSGKHQGKRFTLSHSLVPFANESQGNAIYYAPVERLESSHNRTDFVQIVNTASTLPYEWAVSENKASAGIVVDPKEQFSENKELAQDSAPASLQLRQGQNNTESGSIDSDAAGQSSSGDSDRDESEIIEIEVKNPVKNPRRFEVKLLGGRPSHSPVRRVPARIKDAAVAAEKYYKQEVSKPIMTEIDGISASVTAFPHRDDGISLNQYAQTAAINHRFIYSMGLALIKESRDFKQQTGHSHFAIRGENIMVEKAENEPLKLRFSHFDTLQQAGKLVLGGSPKFMHAKRLEQNKHNASLSTEYARARKYHLALTEEQKVLEDIQEILFEAYTTASKNLHSEIKLNRDDHKLSILEKGKIYPVPENFYAPEKFQKLKNSYQKNNAQNTTLYKNFEKAHQNLRKCEERLKFIRQECPRAKAEKNEAKRVYNQAVKEQAKFHEQDTAYAVLMTIAEMLRPHDFCLALRNGGYMPNVEAFKADYPIFAAILANAAAGESLEQIWDLDTLKNALEQGMKIINSDAYKDNINDLNQLSKTNEKLTSQAKRELWEKGVKEKYENTEPKLTDLEKLTLLHAFRDSPIYEKKIRTHTLFQPKKPESTDKNMFHWVYYGAKKLLAALFNPRHTFSDLCISEITHKRADSFFKSVKDNVPTQPVVRQQNNQQIAVF